MNKKIAIKVDSIFIKTRMKELGFIYRDIETASSGRITEISI